MQLEPEVSYSITGGEQICQWLVAAGQLKSPPRARKSYLFFVDLPHSGTMLQTVVEIVVQWADMNWHSSMVAWFGQVIRAGEVEFGSLHARGNYDLDTKNGSLTFEPDPAFAEIAATSLW